MKSTLSGGFFAGSSAGRGKIFLFIFLMTGLNANSQSFVDIINVNYEISPFNKYDANSDLFNEVDVENISTTIRVPVERKNGDVILTGITANQLTFYTNGSDPDGNRFYSGGVQLGYRRKWSDSLNTLFVFMPKIVSDLENPGDHDIQIGGAVLFDRVKNDEFTWKFGLYSNTEGFGVSLVPLLGMDWKVAEKIRIFGMLPASMTAEYNFSRHYRSGVKFVSSIATYRLTGDITLPYLHQYVNQLSWYHDLYLTKNIVFQGQVGFTAFRYYRLYDREDSYDFSVWGIGFGGKRTPYTEGLFREFGDGMVLQAAIIYRYELNK